VPSLDFAKLKTYPAGSRKSKVRFDAFAKPCRKGTTLRQFYESLPNILAVQELRDVVEALAQAHTRRKTVLWMFGAHVIKVGLSPLLIDCLKRKVVTAIAMNGAGVIHDFELAFMGSTSEDVAEALADGSFGMAEETHAFINGAIREGAKKGWGLGHAVGAMIAKRRLPYRNLSLLATCHELGVPATVHVAIGTDIIHQQSTADGAAIGQTSLADFRKLAEVVATLGRGGVVGNFGSAVILPEVFLKAVSTARNLGHAVKDFTAFDFDMMRHYRPMENVLKRPTLLGGRAIHITGHHELLIPLLVAAVNERL
jgi:deoxyhypusine synthase